MLPPVFVVGSHAIFQETQFLHPATDSSPLQNGTKSQHNWDIAFANGQVTVFQNLFAIFSVSSGTPIFLQLFRDD